MERAEVGPWKTGAKKLVDEKIAIVVGIGVGVVV